jgi:hypothetical protein
MAYDINSFRGTTAKSGSTIPAEKIVAWIEKNFDFKIRKNGAEYIINNPLNGDSGYHFNISVNKGICHDWRGDEWAGPLNPGSNKRNCSFVKFVRLYKKCSYAAALTDILGTGINLKEYLKPENRETDIAAKNKLSVTLPSGAEPLGISTDLQAKILIKWLKLRGYTLEDIVKYDIHHLGTDVFWPYYEFDTLVYWQSRSRFNKRFNFPSLEVYENGKIIGNTEGSKGDFLYGFDEVEMAKYVIITEAIFDQHTLGEQALASGGAVLTDKQIGKIKILGPKQGVILAPDNDKAGIKSLISNQQLLQRHNIDVYYSIPPMIAYEQEGVNKISKDWNELGQFVVGFENVRKLFDDNIKRYDEKALCDLMIQ